MSKRYRTAIIGTCLVFLGTWALAGNLGILAVLPFSSPKLSSLAILIGGIALLFSQARGPIQRAGQTILGICLLGMAVLSRLSGLVDIDGLKISSSEGLAMALMGGTLVAFHIRQLPGGLIQLPLLTMVAVGLFGLVGNSLDLAVFYTGYADVHLSGLTSITLLA